VSSAVIAYGDVVQFDVNVATAAHRIVKASTMAAAPNVISTALVGIAAEADASSVSATSPSPGTIGVICANNNTEFIWPSKATGAQHASSLVGSRRALGYDSTNSMFYLDVANSTAGDATQIVVDVIDPGTTNGLIVTKFISTNVSRIVSGAF
jgi:hypothetical protein